MKFEQYKLVKEHALAAVQAAGVSLPEAGSMNPVLLAYVGDVVFSLYVRLRFLAASSHVRVIHDLSSKAVSAVYQAKALAALMDTLNEQELAVVKRGRNTKSSVPKSASVHEYRMSTAFEALIGWLFLNNEDERLGTIMEQAFNIIIDDFKTMCSHDRFLEVRNGYDYEECYEVNFQPQFTMGYIGRFYWMATPDNFLRPFRN